MTERTSLDDRYSKAGAYLGYLMELFLAVRVFGIIGVLDNGRGRLLAVVAVIGS